jgi:allantoicase
LNIIRGTIDLARADFGGQALLCSDDFFAGMQNLLSPTEAIFIEGKFTDRGKWMDGWESRRKRTPGNDWCIISLGVSGSIHAVDIDTSHFTGNHPPFGAVDVTTASPDATPEQLRDQAVWTEILASSALDPGSHNLFTVAANSGATHLRLRIYPAGGVARLRVYGTPTTPTSRCDLSCATSGAVVICASDRFFAHPDQLLSPAPAEHMGSGWETKRRRTPGIDWLILQLGTVGTLDRIELDTTHFKGNYPERASLEGILWPNAQANLLPEAEGWEPVVTDMHLGPHATHVAKTLTTQGPFSHLRLTIAPDGGVSRLRCYGTPMTPSSSTEPLAAHLNGLSPEDALAALIRCCGASRWAEQMVSARPFTSHAHLIGEAEAIWWRCSEGDWREAFTHHPMVGADPAKLREKFGKTADWAGDEQAGARAASDETLAALASANQAYFDKFGFIFIICASGKSAEEMLSAVEARIHGAQAREIFTAAGEQAKITKLRLEKLIQ